MKLREYLETKGITQLEFANQVGFGRISCSRIVNGHCTPHMSSAMKIVKETNGEVSLEDLLLPSKKPRKKKDSKKPKEKKRKLKVVKRKKAFPKLK
jgi:DNA-binding XRE family transcriptional regulator